jgi:drug/metabolite transporter (DMT)-like permease
MQPIRAIMLKIASVSTFMIMVSLIKVSVEHVPPGEAVFFRSFFALPIIFIWLIATKDLRTGLRTKKPVRHAIRGLAGTLGMGFWFTGLGLLSLPEATAIGFAAPVLAVIFAAILLGETIRAFRIGTVILGLIGVLIILSPRLGNVSINGLGGGETLGAALVLASATFAALAQVSIRSLVKTEKTAAIVFYFTITSTLISLITLPFGWVIPTMSETLMLVLAGLTGGVGQILLTASYKYAPTAVIAPFDYVAMLLAIGVGYFIFDEAPTPVMLAGALVVISAGILIIWRESRLGISRSKARKVKAH